MVAYIDNLLIQAMDKQTCRYHAKITILVLQGLGYRVNFEKSALAPSRVVEHLGLMWDSSYMTILFPQAKIENMAGRTRQLLNKGGCMASKLRSLLGTLKSVRIVTRHTALHYRGLQYQHPRPEQQGVFPSKAWINFSKAVKGDLAWWASSFTARAHLRLAHSRGRLTEGVVGCIRSGGLGSALLRRALSPGTMAHQPQGALGG